MSKRNTNSGSDSFIHDSTCSAFYMYVTTWFYAETFNKIEVLTLEKFYCKRNIFKCLMKITVNQSAKNSARCQRIRPILNVITEHVG